MKRAFVSVMICGFAFAVGCADRPEGENDNTSSSGGQGGSSGDLGSSSGDQGASSGIVSSSSSSGDQGTSSSSSGDQGASSGGSSSGDQGGSSSGAIPDPGFLLMHQRVGCSEIGAAADGRVLVAGGEGAAVLLPTGALDVSFYEDGILAPGRSADNMTIPRFTLDGRGTGFYALENQLGRGSNGKRFSYLLDPSSRVKVTNITNAGFARANAEGNLYLLTYPPPYQSEWIQRVTSAGEVSRMMEWSPGAIPPRRVGPFNSFDSIEHFGATHYVLGTAEDGAHAVYQIAEDGQAVSTFSRVIAPEQSQVRVGPSVLVVFTAQSAAIYSRATGHFRGEFLSDSNIYDIAIDEQDRIYVAEYLSVVRRSSTGEIDASFVDSNNSWTGRVDQLALGLSANRVLVTRCITNGLGGEIQTTYALAR